MIAMATPPPLTGGVRVWRRGPPAQGSEGCKMARRFVLHASRSVLDLWAALTFPPGGASSVVSAAAQVEAGSGVVFGFSSCFWGFAVWSAPTQTSSEKHAGETWVSVNTAPVFSAERETRRLDSLFTPQSVVRSSTPATDTTQLLLFSLRLRNRSTV